MPRWWMALAHAGVSTMPPVESPVLATESATERFAPGNHRVTNVVPGISEMPLLPMPNTA